jgi:DNA-directed RNA polymerase subunit RPC12/RpoP
MSGEEEYGDMEGWIEPDDFTCAKCGKPIDLPRKDGLYEYYENSDSLHGLVCPNCGKQLCDACGNWHKSDEAFITICGDCYDEERRSKIDLDIHNAIIFAAKKHEGQKRKGTDIPYIVHPFEVMQILTENGCDKKVVIAGILHDTLEDTQTSPDEIRSEFGRRVLEIVQSESEDKSKSWKERKQATILHMSSASFESKLVCCADKLSNLRSIYADQKAIGEKVWERFNAKKELIQWYYEEILKSLSEISDSAMYGELEILVDDVFKLEWPGTNDKQ